jgi:chromosome segregation ATPase
MTTDPLTHANAMNKETTRDTPETDGKIKRICGNWNNAGDRVQDFVLADIARKLERERDHSRRMQKKLAGTIKLITTQRDELIAKYAMRHAEAERLTKEHREALTLHAYANEQRKAADNEHMNAQETVDRLRAAIRNMRDVQGRYHTQIATERLFALLPEASPVLTNGNL